MPKTCSHHRLYLNLSGAFGKGISHPEVSWKRDMPASIGDLASVVASSFTPQNNTMRTLGQKSYLLVADEYVNFNSRLAYHFSLVDACLSDNPSQNYISFRFAGGGSTRYRRNLRACFVEICLDPLRLHSGSQRRPAKCLAEEGAFSRDGRETGYLGASAGLH